MDETLASQRLNQKLTNVLAIAIGVLLVVVVTLTMLIASRLTTSPGEVFHEVQRVEKALKELQLSQSEALMLTEVLQQSGVPFAVLNKQGIITVWSDGAIDLFGVTKDSAIGFGPGFIIPQERRSQHHSSFEQLMKTDGEPIHRRVECVATHANGEPIPISLDVWAVPGHTALAIFTANTELVTAR